MRLSIYGSCIWFIVFTLLSSKITLKMFCFMPKGLNEIFFFFFFYMESEKRERERNDTVEAK
jgi:hypothetical protein